MQTRLYNLEGKEQGSLELNDDIFAVKIKPEVVHEVFVLQTSNTRQPWADTKDKSEVRGGGKKPWAQKGTGRARHGSIRSPLWKGGGVTFGPLSARNYSKKINKKVRRLALKMCLSDRVNDGMTVVEDFNFTELKTKLFDKFLKLLPKKKKTYLVVTAQKDEKVLGMTKNLHNVDTVVATDLTVKDIINKQGLIISKEAVNKIEEILTK